ncbi:Polygalacturonase-1 non-catalytic subunit beta [Glycine soja]|nr:Polygalacturonase-1 non-catalytic subunit beta [Glycine soja]
MPVSQSQSQPQTTLELINPFSPKASLIRYWNTRVSNNLPIPHLLLSKASTLTPHHYAILSKLLNQKPKPNENLHHSLCSSPNLLCSFDDTPFAQTHKNDDGNFAVYSNKRFANYGSSRVGGVDSFKNYSNGLNANNDAFRRYSAASTRRGEQFKNYADNGNVANTNFSSYGSAANQASAEFSNYDKTVNVPNLGFTTYDSGASNHKLSFSSYGNETNSGSQTFTSYGKRVRGGTSEFANYADDANILQSDGAATFANYGMSFNVGNDSFTEYGKGAMGKTSFGFKSYGLGRAFKVYNKDGASFSEYRNFSAARGKVVNKWVEPGKFFRESMVKEGNVIPMPDIKDKMPARSFLPLAIASKLPFSSSRINEMREVFHTREGSSTERVMVKALKECERAPSKGETKRCVSSAEEMIGFAVSVLGPNVAVRSTENLNGSGSSVMIGKVHSIDGGKVTKSVSCHQSLYPYLLYYCHSVPKVRVYEAEILDVDTLEKINHGVAICHLDTSAWGPQHGAFLALGFGPGKIEVCHWIFENDLTWTTAS